MELSHFGDKQVLDVLVAFQVNSRPGHAEFSSKNCPSGTTSAVLGMQETAHSSGFKDYCVHRKEMCFLLACSESSLAEDLYME